LVVLRELPVTDQNAEASSVEKSDVRSGDVVDRGPEADRIVGAPYQGRRLIYC
jgi:hypothetical protein